MRILRYSSARTIWRGARNACQTTRSATMNDGDTHSTATVDVESKRSAERIYQLWNEALGAKDIEAAVALYAEDTRLESPLVRHLLGSERGIVDGCNALREFVRLVFERTPPSRRRYRSGFFTDGRK